MWLTVSRLRGSLLAAHEHGQHPDTPACVESTPKKINHAYWRSLTVKGGRRVRDLDATLDGIWWVLRTGAMWSQMPPCFGKWNSVWRCFRRWCERGLWDWVLVRLEQRHRRLRCLLSVDASHLKAHQDAARHPLSADEQKLGKTKGGRNTKLHACVNQAGRAVKLMLLPGPEHESKTALAMLPQDLTGCLVLMDKGYDSDAIIGKIIARGGTPNIPPKANRTRPRPYDRELSKLRARVENFFCRLKKHRRLATRYDKLPQTYLGFVTLAAITDWMR